MFSVLADERIHEFIGGHPLTLGDLRARYGRLARGRPDDGSQIWLNWILRMRGDGTAIGTVQATVSEVGSALQAQIAWVVAPPSQRQGLASEATIAMIDWLEAQGASIVANIHPMHEASKGVARRAGLHATAHLVNGEEIWQRSSSMRRPVVDDPR